MNVHNSPDTVSPIRGWQLATVISMRRETQRTKSIELELSIPTRHRAGQYVVVRLTAPDGYTAQRSYSIATPPGDGRSIELTVDRLPHGEVSTFLHDELAIGDVLEVRGPIGGWFVWDGDTPALLIGGGSGIVPLMAMLRLARSEERGLVHLLVSTRRPSELIYASELVGADTTVIYTRERPTAVARPTGRVTADDIRPHVRDDATVYICGSTSFADAASDRAMEAGVRSATIRVERFGATR